MRSQRGLTSKVQEQDRNEMVEFVLAQRTHIVYVPFNAILEHSFMHGVCSGL